MSSYRVRIATLDDLEALVHHRIGMFDDMGTSIDAARVAESFRVWLAETVPGGIYRAWVVETEEAQIVGGAGMIVLPWPPGMSSFTGRLGFVYNVYTEPPHRRRGVGRLVMETIHDCAGSIRSIGWRLARAAAARRCTSRWGTGSRRRR